MTNYRKILEYHAKGFSVRAIARSLNCNRRTVQDCIERAREAGLVFSSLEELTNEVIQERLYHKAGRRGEGYEMPDFEEIARQLKKKNMTLMLLWYRYVSACKDSGLKYYQQTPFYELFRRYQQKNSISVRINREPGECVEIDWAGDALYLHDPASELKIKASLFVATLSFSDYFYAEAFLDQKVRSWIDGHVNALEFFGGVPAIVTPDYVSRHIIRFMFPLSLCYLTVESPVFSWRDKDFWQHNIHSESSHLSNDSSSCHTAFRG
jgi:transposase